MSNIKELIRREIERRKHQAEESKMEWVNEGYNQNAFAEDCRIGSFDKLLSFLGTLPDESEQPTRGYDEAYLNEKIAKASKSWEGVDVDKFMDEIRGREPVTDCHDLTEAAIDFADYARKALYSKDYAISSIADYDHGCIDGFKAGAEWQKRKMMEGAVEGEVCGRVYDHINVRFADGVCKYLEPKNISHIPADVSKYNIGDKVRIIIVKEDKK